AHINGFQFTGCDFSVAAGAPNVATYNLGIAAYDAGFKADYISTTTPPDKCNFTGHYAGVYALKGTSTYTFSVKNSVFTNNAIGIYVNGVTNESVLFNQFYLKASPAISCNGSIGAFGIDMLGSTGFAIEENTFQKASGAPSGQYYGIRVKDCRAVNQVYKNTFTGLSYANYAVRENYQTAPQSYFKGLAYFCNRNFSNFADFFVEKDNNPELTSGIAGFQGSDELVVGNEFSTTGNTWHFYNGGDYPVGYYFCNSCPFQNPTDTKEYQVTDKSMNISNSCLSHYGGSISGSATNSLVLSSQERSDAELDFAASLNAYNSVKLVYENLKDGGNTNSTLIEIETAWPTDMWELRSDLLGKSPHLSMEVLKAAADKTEVLPESVIFEILAANPDELKKDELITYLENKEHPLPDYMISILRQVAEGETFKTVLEKQMGQLSQQKTRAAYDIVRSILNDTLQDYAQLRNWLDNVGGKQADEQIIETYLSEKNYDAALSLASTMPVIYKYSQTESTEHNMYMQMLNLQIALSQQGRTVHELDSIELDNLQFIASVSNGTAGYQAKAMLTEVTDQQFFECANAETTASLKNSNAARPIDLSTALGLKIEAKPNPATEWIAFDYTLPVSVTQAVINIADGQGAHVVSLPVSGTKGQKVWDIRDIKSGVYFYTLLADEYLKTGKIVISK
ncbi:MAG: hypothetical protein PHU33_17065, partial [Bacteroidales bacterium]|nr:hypothetical protein [Bacteroidales bacterium]